MSFNHQQVQRRNRAARVSGFTFIELLISLLIGTLLMVGITAALSTGFGASETARGKNELNRQARFAMQRMQQVVSQSTWLLLPLGDRRATGGRRENERDVLAVTLPHNIDNDGDGYADADNDRDGRIDEDLPADASNDGESGIVGIDDDGDGSVDEAKEGNDDEFGIGNSWKVIDEDAINGIDDDISGGADGTVDDDPPADMNNDRCPGLCAVDDDGDDLIDEGNPEDDDEDGESDEDWYDALVFYLNGTDLIERTPVPWDENGDNNQDGLDFVEQIVAENVTQFKVVREPMTNERSQLLTLTLRLSGSDGQTVQLITQVRVGGAL